MKKSVTVILSVMSIVFLTGCNKKKQPEAEIIVSKVVEQKIDANPVAMQSYTSESSVELGNATLTYKINRKADSTRVVKDERGQKFLDNKISLTVTRKDNSVVYSHTFVKNDFSEHIGDEYRQHGILEGFVFDKVKGDNTMLFASSVCLPQTDEYIPLVVAITKDGKMNISLDTTMDTNAEE